MLITSFLVLPFCSGGYARWQAAILYAVYSVAIALMMIQCAQASRDRGINPVFIYGFFGGVAYINDSKATNVDSTWYALESMKRPVVWIAGGTDKGNDYEPLKRFAREKVHTLVCMGIDNRKLVESFTGIIPEIISTDSLDAAMQAARKASRPGDVVLLSPACASFDLFKNYENRGELFKQWVAEHAK